LAATKWAVQAAEQRQQYRLLSSVVHQGNNTLSIRRREGNVRSSVAGSQYGHRPSSTYLSFTRPLRSPARSRLNRYSLRARNQFTQVCALVSGYNELFREVAHG
jgi:hypothetical protein